MLLFIGCNAAGKTVGCGDDIFEGDVGAKLRLRDLLLSGGGGCSTIGADGDAVFTSIHCKLQSNLFCFVFYHLFDENSFRIL